MYGEANLDIIFLLDGSASLDTSGFEAVKNWTSRLAGEFDTNSGMVQIGVIQYSHFFADRP